MIELMNANLMNTNVRNVNVRRLPNVAKFVRWFVKHDSAAFIILHLLEYQFYPVVASGC